jgi:hypothetical protein
MQEPVRTAIEIATHATHLSYRHRDCQRTASKLVNELLDDGVRLRRFKKPTYQTSGIGVGQRA